MAITITLNGTEYEIPSNAADTGWAAKLTAFHQALADEINSIGTRTWTNLTLLNGWAVSDDDTPKYSKDESTGRVYLKGQAAVSDGYGTTLATLPVFYRPAATKYFAVIGGIGELAPELGIIMVNTDGSIVSMGTNSSTAGLALDQVSFIAGE